MVADRIIDALRDSLENLGADDQSIKLVYLFGSALKRPLSEASDIDLAFLLDDDQYKNDPIRASYSAYNNSTKVSLKLNKKTDVIILNSSSIEISYEVITMGSCLYAFDVEAKLEYEAKIRGMYYDFMPFIFELRAKYANKLA